MQNQKYHVLRTSEIQTYTLYKTFKPLVMNERHFLVTMILLLTSVIGFSQVRIHTFAGYGPGQNIEAQNIPVDIIVEDNEYAMRVDRKNASYVAGVGVEKEINACFFLATEARYMYESNNYQLFLIRDISTAEFIDGSTMNFTTTDHRISVPLSVGAQFGKFRMISGFDANFTVASNSGLDGQYPQYTYKPDAVSFGWHMGAGVLLGHVGLQVRYSQDFNNVGQGNSFGSQEIKFYGPRSRWLGIVSYYF